eukprot:symbB.v1.2.038825.t1/scaffold6193.1/size20196/3
MFAMHSPCTVADDFDYRLEQDSTFIDEVSGMITTFDYVATLIALLVSECPEGANVKAAQGALCIRCHHPCWRCFSVAYIGCLLGPFCAVLLYSFLGYGITTAKLLGLPMRSVRSDALIQEIRQEQFDLGVLECGNI